MEIEQLEEDLKNGCVVVNIADSFPWKEIAKQIYEAKDNVRIISNPDLIKLYRTYEFSDRFIVLDDSCQYGSVWNYVSEGTLSVEEALESLIGIG